MEREAHDWESCKFDCYIGPLGALWGAPETTWPPLATPFILCPLRDIEDNISADVLVNAFGTLCPSKPSKSGPSGTSRIILSSMSLRGSLFDGFEGQMARDISKMTFKKLIQFRKSIFFVRNAPRNLPVDLPRTRFLRGQRFANPHFFRVSLFKT